MNTRVRSFLLPVIAVLVFGCGGGADEVSAGRYFPLTKGSWWEYETPDGPTRIEVVGQTRRDARLWSIVVTRPLDGNRLLSRTNSYVSDTVLYTTIDGAVYRIGPHDAAPRKLLPFAGSEEEGLSLETVETDTTAAGLFRDCAIVRDTRAGASVALRSLAPGVGVIRTADSAGRDEYRLRAWRVRR
jgi:hypothetical protein